MAERRMFSMKIIDSDEFVSMPLSTQALYFHLSMRADDEGFINKHKNIMRMIGSNEDELKILIAKRFLLTFESGIIVIKHWKLHNYIRKDRMSETTHIKEKNQLSENESGAYSIGYDNQVTDTCQPDDCIGKKRLGEVSLGKGSEEEDRKKEIENSSKEIISHLNTLCNTNYRYKTASTLSSISARLKEGYTLKDFIYVHTVKFNEWNGTDMEKHLNPDTLYRPSNFDKYLNQKEAPKTQSKTQSTVDAYFAAKKANGESEVIDAELD